MFDIFKSRLEIKGTLTTVTALRISQGRSTEPIGSDLPVVKDAFGRPLIPGSSFKGALRSRLESFVRGINPQLAIDPAQLADAVWMNQIKQLKEAHSDDQALTDAMVDHTDLVSQVFGSPWLASKFQVRDLTVIAGEWFGQYQERDGVSIDRDTETAADGRLYDFQVVPACTPFEFKAIVENADAWELGLLAIGLHQFETEQVPLGGGCSRGLGVVKLEIADVFWVDVNDDPEALLRYLQNILNGERGSYVQNQQQYQTLKDQWTQAFIQKLHQGIPSTSEISN